MKEPVSEDEGGSEEKSLHPNQNFAALATKNAATQPLWPVLFAVLSIALGYFWVLDRKSSILGSDTYAICSRKGDMVYTVDDKNTQTQCVVVSGSYIVDTGSLRGFFSQRCCLEFP